MKLKELLDGKLTKRQLEILRGSFDIIGDIAILEIDPLLEKKEEIIAKAVIEMNRNIKVVCKKKDIHKGKFRTQKLKIVFGERRKETIHKENNVRLKLNVETSYYSPRSANERIRIFKQVKKGEEILVMFSGIGPLPVVLSKNTDAKKIVGIEINPEAHKYAVENLKLNKINNVELINSDVNDVKIKKKFDRILMPLPKTAEEFLPLAFRFAKKGTIIHYYNFLSEEDFPQERKFISGICKENRRKCRILRIVKCGHYKPYVFRTCSDIKIM